MGFTVGPVDGWGRLIDAADGLGSNALSEAIRKAAGHVDKPTCNHFAAGGLNGSRNGPKYDQNGMFTLVCACGLQLQHLHLQLACGHWGPKK
jgi:hypothetical protein